MTYREKIMEIVNQNVDLDKDSFEKAIKIAYMMGRESAAKEVSGRYNDHIAEQRERAKACRYSHMAEKIVGEETYIYSPDYAGEFTAEFGGDTYGL